MTSVCENGCQNMTTVNTRVLVSRYFKHHLDKHNLPWNSGVGLPSTTGDVERTMQVLGDEFEERYREVFEEMSQQLHITPDTANQTFLGVVNELFSDGINWGRIVALFAFGATLAVQCIENEMPAVVDQLVEWITHYIDNHLYSWIQEHNGWDGFIAFYEGGPDRNHDSSWPSIKKISGYAVAAIGVGITLGALFTQRT